MSFIEWFLSFIYKIKTFPLIIQITIVLTLVFIISSLALMITIWTIRRRYNRIQKKLEETLPEIKKLFEDILFTNKIYTESEIYKNSKLIILYELS